MKKKKESKNPQKGDLKSPAKQSDPKSKTPGKKPKVKATTADDDVFGGLIASANNQFLAAIEELDETHDRWIDTGSFALNAQQSATIYGGFQKGKVVVLAGEESTGKTFMLLKMVKIFLDSDPRARVIIFESEWAIRPKDLLKRGIDITRVQILPITMIEKLRFQAYKIVENYQKLPKKSKFPLMMGVDSLGQINTSKELQDVSSGEEKADMGARAKLIKSFFRAMTIPLGVADIPLICTAHLYVDPSKSSAHYIKQIMGGGKGAYYAASQIVFFSKRKESDSDKVQTGIIISSRAQKSRASKEGTLTELLVKFSTGLSRYYGLLDIAEEAGLAKKVKNKYLLKGQEKPYFEKSIYKNPQKFFTEDVLDDIDEFCQTHYKLSDDTDSLDDEDDIDPDDSQIDGDENLIDDMDLDDLVG